MVGAGRLSTAPEQKHTARHQLVIWALIICALTVAAYLPTLFGGFVYDDVRFVEENEAIRSLSPGSIVSFFTDPKTVASVGWKGIYRPLRTLDFAVDYVVSGGRPWFFHLRNVLYHALGAILLMLVLRELLGDGKGARRNAFLGALLFALHPVNTEAVAWITSRGDVLVLVFFLLALFLHLRGRTGLAALVLVIALLSKESAVVFVGVAVVCDLYRRARLQFRWYGVYAGLALCYVVLWKLVMPGPDLMPGHLATWWGGSYGANLLTMSQGYLLYLHRMILPVDLLVDYHVPSINHLTPGSAISIAVLAIVTVMALRGGRRSRLALAFFVITLFPVSNLMIKVGIPTAERFLYLPLIGLVILVAPWLSRTRLIYAVFVCFFLLTFSRTMVWRSIDIFWAATNARAVTPRGLAHLVATELRAAHQARERIRTSPMSQRSRHVREMQAHAAEVVRRADELMDLYENWIRMPANLAGSGALSRKSNALMLLQRPEEALEAADQALKISADPEQLAPEAWYNAALAFEALGQPASAAANLEKAREVGYQYAGDLTVTIATLWVRAAAMAEAEGNLPLALSHYRQSWNVLPDHTRNAAAYTGIERLSR